MVFLFHFFREQQKKHIDEMREKDRLARQEILRIQEHATLALKDQDEKYRRLKRGKTLQWFSFCFFFIEYIVCYQ